MAAREYAYYIKGNRICLVEKDTAFDNDPTSRDYGPGSGRAQWQSPLATVASGLEFEYTYAPWWRLGSTSYVNTTLTHYNAYDGYLVLKDLNDSPQDYTSYTQQTSMLSASSAYDNVATEQAINTTGGAWQGSPTWSWIVLENAEEFNGAHRITNITSTGTGTNNALSVDTQYNGSTSNTAFVSTPNLYYNVMTLYDDPIDDMELPVTDYQADALVYFIKAKLAEDRQDFDKYEYFMSKFKKMVEQNESAKIWGARMISSGPNAIR